uniref:Uncharacterized protein n=1 Tax=Physcomitrium patens TaxID=3218 RepID=A0A2K1KQ85_PHYPA|nr:hypothetical protein PHYPA_006825 [Physcomitrium patens]
MHSYVTEPVVPSSQQFQKLQPCPQFSIFKWQAEHLDARSVGSVGIASSTAKRNVKSAERSSGTYSIRCMGSSKDGVFLGSSLEGFKHRNPSSRFQT